MLAFAALADPTRLHIVEMLSRGELSSTNISRHFNVSAPAISQHLKVLREAKLVTVETKAQQRIYTLNPQAINEMEQWLGHMRQIWTRRFDALDELLNEEMAKTKKPKTKGKKHVR